jgi:hypothetical protein
MYITVVGSRKGFPDWVYEYLLRGCRAMTSAGHWVMTGDAQGCDKAARQGSLPEKLLVYRPQGLIPGACYEEVASLIAPNERSWGSYSQREKDLLARNMLQCQGLEGQNSQYAVYWAPVGPNGPQGGTRFLVRRMMRLGRMTYNIGLTEQRLALERRSAHYPSQTVNVRTAGYDVYIGRGGPWGNPIRLGRVCPVCGQTHTVRGSTLPCYEAYLRNRLAQDAPFRDQFSSLEGKTLGCYCSPAPCHGEIMELLLAGG